MQQSKPISYIGFDNHRGLPPSQLRINYGRSFFAVLTFFAVAALTYLGFFAVLTYFELQNTILDPICKYIAYGIAGWLSLLVLKLVLRPFNLERHIKGRQYVTENTTEKIIGELGKGCDGIEIAPKVRLPRTYETRTITACGSPGSGKSVFIKSILHQILQRGRERAIIFDPKGDFASLLNTMNVPHYVFRPWSKATHAIDFAKDITTEMDAFEFASKVIPKPDKGEANWALGAQRILVGLLMYLIKTAPQQWTLSMLNDLINSDIGTMRTLLRSAYPAGAAVIESDGKTTDSYMSMLRTSSVPLQMLADRFRQIAPSKTISLKDWVLNRTNKKFIILAGSQQYSELQKIMANFAVTTIANKVASLPDSSLRSIWFFLDEFPQLGKCESVFNLQEFSRSKGAKLLIGYQDINQIVDIYSKEQANALLSMAATNVYFAISGGATADQISKKIGERMFEQLNVNVSSNAQGDSSSSSWQTVIQPVFMPAQFQTDLGAEMKNKSVVAVYGVLDITGTKNIYRMRWPIVNYQAPPIPNDAHLATKAAFARIKNAEHEQEAAAVQSRTQAPTAELIMKAQPSAPEPFKAVAGKPSEKDYEEPNIINSAALSQLGDIGHAIEIVSEIVDASNQKNNLDHVAAAKERLSKLLEEELEE